ncbi:MAG TPA: FecR domain-containing protein [Sunxiuqinia sp.]|nr:FecR domain-containing protein [Sunxiuqinia sp.]
MKNVNDILNLLIGQLGKDHKEELLSQLDQDSESKKEFGKLKNAWALASSQKKMPDYQKEKLYLDFKEQLENRKSKGRVRALNFWRYAAVFILAVGLSSLFFYTSPNFISQLASGTHFTTAIAENGQISKVILPDLSVVWLNSGSTIKYNNNFDVNNREIQLTGQAFFQVTKNKHLPLKVFSKNLEVKVVGTRFDVSAYPEDHEIKVVLERGKVIMHNTKIRESHYELNPGEMAQFDPSSGKVARKKVNPKRFISWKDGILIFRDDPMAEVIPQLQRRYNVNIIVKDPKIFNSVFTATIKDETLEDILKSISFACHVHYQIIKGNNLTSQKEVILSTN